MSAKKSVVLFYDVISPYSWLGFELISRYQQKWNIALHLRPVLLAGIMAAKGKHGPGLSPAEARYLLKDLERMRGYAQVPIKQPSSPVKTLIQKGSLNAQRLLTVVSQSAPDKLEDMSRALWLRIFNMDKDCTEPGSLLEACQAAGISEADSQTLLARTKETDIKEALKKNTAEAVEHGAFGLPSFLVEDSNGDKQLVYGSDHLYMVAHILGERFDGPLNELAKTKL